MASNVPSTDKASGVFPVTSSSREATSGEGHSSSHGPLPKWAFYDDPALTNAQVKDIESQMRQEYRKLPLEQRQSLLLKDLQEALSSIRLAYSRSTNVGSSTIDDMNHRITTPTALTTDVISQSAHNFAQALGLKDEILTEQTAYLVNRNLVSAEMQRGKQASTDPSSKNPASPTPTSSFKATNKDTASFQTKKVEKMPVVAVHSAPPEIGETNSLFELPRDASPRRSNDQPAYDTSGVSGRNVQRKRKSDGYEVGSKRQRIERASVLTEDGHASIVSTTYVPRPAAAPPSPELHPQAAPVEKLVVLNHDEHHTEPYPPLLSSLESSPSADVFSEDDTDSKKTPSISYQGRKWPQEDVALLAKARADGQSWDNIMQVSWKIA